MLIDCETCVARDIACDECVVAVLLRSPSQPVALDPDEHAAIGSLAMVGLVPPLRLEKRRTGRTRGSASDTRGIA